MISESIARLQAGDTPLKLVGGAAQFQAAAENNPKAVPAAFVFQFRESPGRNEVGDNYVIQRVTVSMSVVLVVRNVSDTTGAAANQDMSSLRDWVKDQLFGWQPAQGCDPFSRGESGLLAFKDGHMWWQDLYISSYIDRSN